MTGSNATACPDEGAFVRLGEGQLEASEREALLAHADGCSRCHRLLVGVLIPQESVTQLDTRPEKATRLPKPGDRIAHYTIKETIGRGGMGVVLRAHDTKLGRDIALKLIASVRDEQAERRLTREAQAMAQLSHPNVVAVHDVGQFGDGVYFAMELVEGTTMRRWQKDTQPDWRQLVLVWVAAGSGLVAAHAAGIVHRDFKPANVLIGDDRRPRVTDFGLAGVTDVSNPSWDGAGEELSSSLTQTGTLIGTPRYMSPEQMSGAASDHRSDQFSFAVSLYNALYDGFPFEGRSLDELRNNLGTKPPTVPRFRDRPTALWPVLRRALQTQPADRYASMEPMLAELHRICDAPQRRRRRLAVGAIGLVGIAGGVVLGDGIDEEPCADFERQLAAVWDLNRGAALEASMRSSSLPHAGDVAARVRTRLDQYGQAWTSAATEICQATRVHGTQSEALLDARMGCTKRHLVELTSVVEALAEHNDAKSINRAITVVSALSSPASCRDARLRQPAADVPPEVQRAVEAANATLKLGQYAEALAMTTTLLEQDLPPAARAAALFTEGGARMQLSDFELGLARLHQAGLAAAEAGDDALVAKAQLRIAANASYLNRAQESRAMMQAAEMSTRRAHDPPRLIVALATQKASEHYDRAELDAALTEADRAVAAAESLGDDLKLAQTRLTRSTILAATPHTEQAVVATDRALEEIVRLLGPRHPGVAKALREVTSSFLNAGRFEQARGYAERRVAAVSELFPDNKRRLGAVHLELAITEVEMSASAEAVEHAQRAIALFDEVDPKITPPGAFSVLALGYSLQQRHQEAIAQAKHALWRAETDNGADHPLVTMQLHAYGEILRRAGRYDEAIERFEATTRVARPDDLVADYARFGIAQCRAALGDPQARLLLERALERYQSVAVDTADVAEAQFEVARARIRDGDDSGLALARKAEVTLDKPRSRELHAEVVAWLAEHDHP